MASKTGAEIHEGSSEEALNDPTLYSVSTVAPEQHEDENSDFTTSCPAIMEPSEDDPLYKREKIRRSVKTYKAIMKSYNSTDILINSDEPSNDGEYEQENVFDRCKNFAVKFRNSNFIYILKIWSTFLPFTAIIMGDSYGPSCPVSPDLVGLTVLTGVFGVLLALQWIFIGFWPPGERPCEGQQKFGILFFFIMVSAMLEYEIYLFSKLPHNFDPSTRNYCHKTFYDYTYYKFIAAFATMLPIVLLYFPGYQSHATGLSCANPATDNCYRGTIVEQ